MVWRNGVSPATVTYTLEGNASGKIDYYGSCGTRCYEWHLTSYAYDPVNATKIQGISTSTSDVCDGNYVGYYAPPWASNWTQASTQTCYDNGTQYVYWTTGTTGFTGSADYAIGNRMVRWDYRFSGLDYTVRVYYGGNSPG